MQPIKPFWKQRRNSIAEFKAQRLQAFTTEVERWKDEFDAPAEMEILQDDTDYSQYSAFNAWMSRQHLESFCQAGQLCEER